MRLRELLRLGPHFAVRFLQGMNDEEIGRYLVESGICSRRYVRALEGKDEFGECNQTMIMKRYPISPTVSFPYYYEELRECKYE